MRKKAILSVTSAHWYILLVHLITNGQSIPKAAMNSKTRRFQRQFKRFIKSIQTKGTAAPEQIGAYVKRMKDAVRG